MTDTDAPPAPTGEELNELDALIASAEHLYAIKNYEDAAEKYSDAAALQETIHGEMNPANADLLYAYGRCLYKVAVAKSDVLGGKVAGEKEPGKTSKKRKRDADGPSTSTTNKDDQIAEKVVEKVVESRDGTIDTGSLTISGADKSKDSKPFFQISGDDADWDSSEDDEENDGEDAADDEDGAGDGEDDDDLGVAYEVLDMARVLLSRKVEALRSEGKGKGVEGESSELRKVLEKLADTRDQQAEICLENERFADAIEDAKASLDLKLEMYPKESSIVAEAHFKLSLALEFASTSYLKTDGAAEDATKGQNVDEEKRKEAATHMEAAIESSRLRISKQEQLLAGMGDKDREKAQRQIADVKEMVDEMDIRLQDLRNPAIDINKATGPAGAADDSNPLGGILGSILGETETAKKARIEEATKTANDLTSMVRHKKKSKPAAEPSKPKASETLNGNGKRAAEEPGEAGSKKPKM